MKREKKDLIEKYSEKIAQEFVQARTKYPEFKSFGEADFALRKQYDRFFHEIINPKGLLENIETHLIQLAAVALGTLVEVLENHYQDDK